MDRDAADLIRVARGEVRAAQDVAAEVLAALSRAEAALDSAVLRLVADGIAAQPASSAPINEHRREHRPGRPARLDTDAELRAFVLARIDRLTFEEIADEVARRYPVERRVGKSTIHQWWRRNEARYGTSGNPPD